MNLVKDFPNAILENVYRIQDEVYNFLPLQIVAHVVSEGISEVTAILRET